MSIDVNPSIELGFNKNLKVIELIPYNEEGKKIIEELGDWKLKGIHEVADSILNTIKSKGYLKKSRRLSLVQFILLNLNKRLIKKLKRPLVI